MKRKIRLSTKLCLLVGIVAVICLVSLALLQNSDTTKLNYDSTVNNIQTALSAQDIILNQFITDSENSLKQYGTAAVIKKLLEKQKDPTFLKMAQAYTEQFYKTLPSWEAVYIGNANTTVLTHSAKAAVGMTTRKPNELEAFFAPCKEADDGFYNGGVFVSPASGKIILNMRMGIKDNNGNIIGYVGGGPFVSALSDRLQNYKIAGLDDVSYTIVDSEKKLYVTNDDDSKIAQEVEDENILNAISQVDAGTDIGEITGENDLICYRNFEGSPLILIAEIPLKDVEVLSKALANKLIIYCVVTLIVILLGIWIISFLSTRPLKHLAAATETLADGYIDKPIDVKVSVYETTQIKNASLKLQQYLVDLRDHLTATSTSLTGSADETHEICASSEDSAELISDAMTGLTNSTNSMVGSVNTLKTEIDDIENNVNNINGSVEQLAESSGEMDTISEQAKNDINDVYESSEKSVLAATEIASKMTELHEAIQAVANASGVISGISSQTSLLSLNASIEAARAGEAGKGFAVVAGEIGELATQSDESTKEIDMVVGRMQELAKISVEAADNIKDIILNEQEIVKKTQDSFMELKQKIDDSISQISTIEEANTRLLLSKNNAISSIDNLAEISTENTDHNSKVNDSLGGLTKNVTELFDKTEDMTKMAGTLQDALKLFKA